MPKPIATAVAARLGMIAAAIQGASTQLDIALIGSDLLSKQDQKRLDEAREILLGIRQRIDERLWLTGKV